MCYKEYFSEHSDMDLDAFLGFILNNVVMIYISADSFHRVTHWIFQASKGYTISYMAQQKAMYANAYERWTDEDDQRLLYLYSQGKKISELMQIFARNKGAIKSRILKLTGKEFYN